MAMVKEDVEAAMTLLLLRGGVATGVTKNGAKIHGRNDLPPKKKEKDELEEAASCDLDLLPDQVRNHIESLNGTEIAFVMKKILEDSDLNRNQNRLSVNTNKVQNEFLTQEEVDKIGQATRGLEVTVIQPCLEITQNVELRKRSKNNGQYFEFVLTGNWFQLAQNKNNGLKKKTDKVMELPNWARFVFCISESLKT